MKRKIPKIFGVAIMALVIMAMVPTMASAHCDTMDGPVIIDAQKAIETNNPSYFLKWITAEDEKEVTTAFELAMKVRTLSPEAQELADKYFYDTFVRVHRAGENESFTGVQPHGVPIDEKVAAADKSIEVGNLSPLETLVPEDQLPELQERLDKVLALKDYDVNSVEAGREYVEAYVQFFKFAEGEEHVEDHGTGHVENESVDKETATNEKLHSKESQKAVESIPVIPWSLAGVLFITTLIFGIAHFRRHSKH